VNEWQWVQIGLQVGLALGQLGMLMALVRSNNTKIESVNEKLHQHIKEVADKYVKKEDLKDTIEKTILFMYNDLLRRLEKLEGMKNDREG